MDRVFRRRWRSVLPGAIAVVAALFVFGPRLADGLTHADRVVAGVHALDRDFSHLRYDEVDSAAELAFMGYAWQPVKLYYGGAAVSFFPAEAGVTLDVEATASAIREEEAHESWGDRLATFLGLPRHRVVLPTLRVDRDRLETVVSRLGLAINQPARDAELSVDDGAVRFRNARSGLRLEPRQTAEKVSARIKLLGTEDVEAVVEETPPRIGDSDLADAQKNARSILALPVELYHGDLTWTLNPADLARLLILYPSQGASQPASIRWNDDAVKALLADIARDVNVPAKDARVEWKAGGFRLSAEVEGKKLDAAKTATLLQAATRARAREVEIVFKTERPAVRAADWQEPLEVAEAATARSLTLGYENRSWTISASDLAAALTFDLDSAGKPRIRFDQNRILPLIGDIAKQIDRPSREPRFRVEEGKVTLLDDGEDGNSVDVAGTLAAIARQVFTGQRSVEVIVAKHKPKITVRDVARVSFPDEIVEAATSYAGSIPARAHNIELAASRLNGTLVAPGEIFSFNRSVGPTISAAGYQIGYGISLQGNQPTTVPAEAGGICQVATTLFHAVFWSGLPVVDRQSHLYWIARYGTPPRGLVGLDATVDDPYVDFRFRNSTDGWLLVEAKADGSNVRFALRGKKTDWEVKVEPPVITDVVAASRGIVSQEDPTLPKGKELDVEHAEDGFTAKIKRTVTRGSNILDSLELVSRYMPARNVVLVGSGELPTDTATPTGVVVPPSSFAARPAD